MFRNLLARFKANRPVFTAEKSSPVEDETSAIKDESLAIPNEISTIQYIYDLEIVVPNAIFENFMSAMIVDEPGVESYQYGPETGARTAFDRIQFSGTEEEAKAYEIKLYEFPGARVWVK